MFFFKYIVWGFGAIEISIPSHAIISIYILFVEQLYNNILLSRTWTIGFVDAFNADNKSSSVHRSRVYA